jgi:phosphotransferase system HPr (HPr) family protein
MDAPTPEAASAAPADSSAADVSVEAVLRNPMGLHSRPAALVVKAVGGFDADVSIANVTSGAGPASALSMIGLLALGAVGGATVRISAGGPDAAAAVDAVRRLVDDGFGEIEQPPA